MDRNQAKRLSKAMETDERVREFLAEHGVEVEHVTLSYGSENGQIRIEYKEIGAAGRLETDFVRYAKIYGLDEKDLGREFVHQGTRYRVEGAAPKNKKYPIIGSRVEDGRRYKFPADAVRDSLVA